MKLTQRELFQIAHRATFGSALRWLMQCREITSDLIRKTSGGKLKNNAVLFEDTTAFIGEKASGLAWYQVDTQCFGFIDTPSSFQLRIKAGMISTALFYLEYKCQAETGTQQMRMAA